MRTGPLAAAAVVALLATPTEAAAGRYGGHGHWGGHGGGRYWGGHVKNYYGGAWPSFGFGVIVGTALNRPWARHHPAYYGYPPVPYYAYPPPPAPEPPLPPAAPTPPNGCGSWVWVEPELTWFWEPCASGEPDAGAPPAPAARVAPRG